MTRNIGDLEHDQGHDQGNVVAYEALSLPQPHLILKHVLMHVMWLDKVTRDCEICISATQLKVGGPRERARVGPLGLP